MQANRLAHLNWKRVSLQAQLHVCSVSFQPFGHSSRGAYGKSFLKSPLAVNYSHVDRNTIRSDQGCVSVTCFPCFAEALDRSSKRLLYTVMVIYGDINFEPCV